MRGIFNKLLFLLCRSVLLFILFSLSSCATPFKIQSQVNSLISVSKYDQAASALGDDINSYGKNNTLLYLMDKGYVYHLKGDYKRSIATFEKSKQRFDDLYTQSVTKIAGSWLINDYAAPYRGEDFERVMINVFQALNYCLLGDIPEALVEARDVDSKLSMINSLYKPDEKNAYREDAFARLLMGALYEANKRPEDLNNAYISYAKAVETYENDYARNYKSALPRILKENILSAAEFMGPSELSWWRARYAEAKFLSLDEKARKAEVYLIQYNGFSPKKIEGIISVPLSGGVIVQFAFPKYKAAAYHTRGAIFAAVNGKNEAFKTETELGEDISAIAIKNLENRRLRVLAKAALSSAGKYFIEKKQEENIKKQYGPRAAESFKILSSIFNVASSRADLRSWQTLPAEIRLGRLVLEPGEYDFSVTNIDSRGGSLDVADLGKVKLSAGQKKFFLLRSLK